MSDPAETLTVGVVGAGTMGAGIAQVCLQAGHDVLLFDVDHEAIERGRARIADGLQRLVDKGKLPPDGRERMLAALRDAHSLEGLAEESDIVIEAALEDLALKETVFRALGSATPVAQVLATNTSALSVTDIGDASGQADRVIGLHFFNPAPVMPLVEVVVGDRTSQQTISKAAQFATDLGKTAVVCRDSPGFIVNRVNRPFTLEGLRMLETGEAGVQQVDQAIRSSGYPMGPFELIDLVGVDVNLAVATALWHGFDEAPRFAPSQIQHDLVESGSLGRKTGVGFYRYEGGRPAAVAWDSNPGSLRDEEIVARIELPIINEAYLAVGELVAEAGDIDRAMRLGANHPYGPFERAGQLGLRNVIDGLRALETVYGERFQVARTLWDIASI
ncbi:MAG TPA: 3-hydroxyacyl-CoA dehydrogenase NAD-binding domain-containing protein [Candidatus Limnocylindrales bacterium]